MPATDPVQTSLTFEQLKEFIIFCNGTNVNSFSIGDIHVNIGPKIIPYDKPTEMTTTERKAEYDNLLFMSSND